MCVCWGWQDGPDTGKDSASVLGPSPKWGCLRAWGDQVQGSSVPSEEQEGGLICPDACAGPRPGSLVRSDMALLAMGTGRRVEARRAASILDPKGQGVCEMGGLDNQHRNSQKAEKVWVEKQTVGSSRGPPVHPLLVGRTS